MEKAAKSLNLCGHTVRGQVIFGPGDIELHVGTDHNLYVLDFSRLFPPEHPQRGPPESVFYNFLRPELVQLYHTPLCSDALTAWVNDDQNRDQLNDDVTEATKYLHHWVIPQFASQFNDQTFITSLLEDEMVFLGGSGQAKKRISLTELVMHLHRSGINVRHIGLVRARLQTDIDPMVDEAFMVEMIARVIKNEINNSLRLHMQALQSPSQTAYHHVAFHALNRITDHQQQASFWTDPSQLKSMLIKRFGHKALKPAELCPTHSLLPNRSNLLQRICVLSRIKLTQEFLRALQKFPASKLIEGDLCYKPKIKYLSCIEYLNAKTLFQEVTTTPPGSLSTAQSHLRMLTLAEEHLLSGLRTTPSSRKLQKLHLKVQFEIWKKKPTKPSREELILLNTQMKSLLTKVQSKSLNYYYVMTQLCLQATGTGTKLSESTQLKADFKVMFTSHPSFMQQWLHDCLWILEWILLSQQKKQTQTKQLYSSQGALGATGLKVRCMTILIFTKFVSRNLLESTLAPLHLEPEDYWILVFKALSAWSLNWPIDSLPKEFSEILAFFHLDMSSHWRPKRFNVQKLFVWYKGVFTNDASAVALVERRLISRTNWLFNIWIESGHTYSTHQPLEPDSKTYYDNFFSWFDPLVKISEYYEMERPLDREISLMVQKLNSLIAQLPDLKQIFEENHFNCFITSPDDMTCKIQYRTPNL